MSLSIDRMHRSQANFNIHDYISQGHLMQCHHILRMAGLKFIEKINKGVMEVVEWVIYSAPQLILQPPFLYFSF